MATKKAPAKKAAAKKVPARKAGAAKAAKAPAPKKGAAPTKAATKRAPARPALPPIEIDARALPPLGMTPARFLRDYWQKRPLLIRNAFPGFTSPITPEDLAGLACEDEALARIVRHDRARDHYALETGPFPEAYFPTLPRTDWTLLVQDVDKWDADIRALLPHFDFLPRWRVDDVMVSFAAPGGSVGAHVDQYDVFLLQAHGHRRWQINDDPHAPTAFRDDSALKLLVEFTPTHEWVLGPGDMLYLPPGAPHHGVAEDACLTFSVGMRAPSASELLLDFAETMAATLPEEARYADPDLAPAADASEIDAAAFARLERALAPLLQADEAQRRAWFGRFITTYRAAGDLRAPARLPDPATLANTLDAGGHLARHPGARLAWAREGRAARFFAHGEDHRLPLADARLLAGHETLDASDVAALGDAGREVLVGLIERGVFTLVKPARSRRR